MELVMTMPESVGVRHAHLSTREVARFVEKLATPEERSEVERHLNQCDTCRTEIVQVARFARSRATRRRVAVAVPITAAAAVLLWIVSGPPTSEGDPNAFRAGSDGLQRIEAVMPVRDRVIRSDTVSFVWRSAGPGAQYSITITDTRGDPVRQTLVSDSTFSIPTDALRSGGEVFFWRVDAALPDGSTASTGAKQFSIAR